MEPQSGGHSCLGLWEQLEVEPHCTQGLVPADGAPEQQGWIHGPRLRRAPRLPKLSAVTTLKFSTFHGGPCVFLLMGPHRGSQSSLPGPLT